MKLAYFNNNAGLVPLGGVGADLVLDSHIVSDFQWWEVDIALR